VPEWKLKLEDEANGVVADVASDRAKARAAVAAAASAAAVADLEAATVAMDKALPSKKEELNTLRKAAEVPN
jgi:hypothetical protein